MKNCISSYLTTVFDQASLKKTVKYICQLCEVIGLDNFDSLSFRGMSGAVVAPIVSWNLNKPMIMVRKEGDGSHSSHRVEGHILSDRILIIDDLVSTGDTLNKLVKDLNEARTLYSPTLVDPVKVIGIILYNEWKNHDRGIMEFRDVNYFKDVPVYVFKFDRFSDHIMFKTNDNFRKALPHLKLTENSVRLGLDCEEEKIDTQP
jgi:hypothetical protein